MSVERSSTRKPNPYSKDEGCKESSKQQSEAAHHSGGVSVDGMSGSDAKVSQEICPGAEAKVQRLAVQAGQTSKAERAGTEVGVSRSSDKPMD